MKVALKNCVELLSALVDFFDFAINESCNVWNECDVSIQPFASLIVMRAWEKNVGGTGDQGIVEL